MKKTIFIISLFILLLACDNHSQNPISKTNTNSIKQVTATTSYKAELKKPLAQTVRTGGTTHKKENKSSDISVKSLLQTTQNIIKHLKDARYDKLSLFIEPKEGLNFSPYTSSPLSLTHFKKNQIPALLTIDKKYIWGKFDGSGLPIVLSPKEYINDFVYDIDYLSLGELIYINSKPLIYKHDVEFIARTYPQYEIVISHYKGSKDIGFKDFKTLVLILKRMDNKWFLVAIAHTESTV